jgi:DtxR family Mn-dependent transcriptional regulator
MTATVLLIWIISLLLLGILIFLPNFGLLARWRAYRINRQREQVEDSLKHLLNREQSGRHASPESLAGGLQLSMPAALRLIDRMETQGLLQSRPDGMHLTPQGERWALQVVRAHRLWERYLAYEARLPLEKIHREAHHREHHMSVQQVDELDAQLGYPQNDPHGDPIPNRDGVFSEDPSKSLTDWPLDTPGKIVQLEDEPPVVYAQILAEGLRLGQVVRVLEASPERILLSDGESEFRLAPSVAANVFLRAIPVSPASQPGVIPLSELADGRQGEVVDLDAACQGFTRRRLLDLGMTPGAQLVPEMRNFFGDPRAYRIRGTLIALRKEQAGQVWVRPVKEISDE